MATGSGSDTPVPGIPDLPFSPVSIRVQSPVVLKSGGSADVSFHLPDGMQPGGALKLPPYGLKGSYEIYSGAAVCQPTG